MSLSFKQRQETNNYGWGYEAGVQLTPCNPANDPLYDVQATTCAVCGRSEYRWGTPKGHHWICFSIHDEDFSEAFANNPNPGAPIIFKFPCAVAKDVTDSLVDFIHEHFGGKYIAVVATLSDFGTRFPRRSVLSIQESHVPSTKSASKT